MRNIDVYSYMHHASAYVSTRIERTRMVHALVVWMSLPYTQSNLSLIVDITVRLDTSLAYACLGWHGACRGDRAFKRVKSIH